EYFARFHTDTVVHSQTALAFSLQEMGASRMMFASDAPWVPVKRHADMMGALDISAEDAERIWSGTAREFFGL
ncbi:MAG: amidohydrolase family protein, partial [Nitrospinae bacterium]|nr:amidohydrolase family protein [Nitrospinota bacterium]